MTVARQNAFYSAASAKVTRDDERVGFAIV